LFTGDKVKKIFFFSSNYKVVFYEKAGRRNQFLNSYGALVASIETGLSKKYF
jgi:ssDNA-specific exonuclease RecJ